jgi:hypothetical protein
LGSVLGVLTFLGGVALMLLVFGLARDMFNTPPREALGLKPGEAIDLNLVGPTLVNIVIRIVLLIVMGLVGSLIANRGISLFTAARSRTVATTAPSED